MIPYTNSEIEFRLEREIGQEGRNSQVFIAHDNQLDAEIVIKRMLRSDFDDEDEYFKEASILYKSAHAFVVPIQYASKDETYIYIALPYYPQGSLKKRMEENFLTVRDILRFSTQFLSGLHNIHSKGLVHFDIKPDNVLISTRDEAMLSDFGLAKHTNVDGVASLEKVYIKQIPPERLESAICTTAFDIYQCGLTLYRMCNGDYEFEKQFLTSYNISNPPNEQEQFFNDLRMGTFPDRDKFPNHIPDRLRNIIKRCLMVNPEERFGSVIELMNELSSIDGNVLDWQYEENPTEKKWLKNIDGKIIYIKLNQDDSTIAKRVSSKGTERAITDYTKTSLTKRQFQKFFKEY